MWSVAIISAIATLAQAGKIHPFFAENNFICELCQNVIELANKGDD